MADTTIANLTDGTTADATDRLPVERSPFGAGTNRYVTPTYLRTLFGITNFTVTGPTVDRIYTFPDSAATILYSGGALGTPTSGTLTNATGLPEAGLSITDNTTANVSITAHGFAPKAPNVATQFLDGTGAWSTPAGGATLNGITAATGAVTIASGNNTGIVWNWANTTNTTVAMTLGETTAATNGTLTGGVPNQVLLKLITLSNSTQSPLSVYSNGVHVFSVSPTTAQIIAANGNASAPPYSFTGSTSGLFGNSGLVAISLSEVENARYLAGALQSSKGTADAVSYAMNFRKSRGTVASPTVITTGDDLATISGFGYVGATNTYQEACRITFDSTGTISDSATGIGGIIAFSHATVGAEPVTVAQLKSQHLVHSGTAPTISAGGGTNPTIVGTDEACVVTIGTGGTATTVTVTFGNAFTTNPPVCVAQSDTDIVPFKIVSTTTTVKIDATLAFTAGSKITIISRGWE